MTDEASVTADGMNVEERELIAARVEELAAKVERLERLIAGLVLPGAISCSTAEDVSR
ncbi:hypothetical protein [Streptomyces sp. NBC_01803]|uniref:hypothetical protein n=1 Tax=Streptomyces sp. NBC_01803 TaxID=2975946 RepID=UPI002DD928B5|nr:hypothetical protein [Streptomyces sp. NBC_01803]WSA45107.1 hypothetical protein OIE51_13360 [Streptomyces sp. NBC_01803]